MVDYLKKKALHKLAVEKLGYDVKLKDCSYNFYRGHEWLEFRNWITGDDCNIVKIGVTASGAWVHVYERDEYDSKLVVRDEVHVFNAEFEKIFDMLRSKVEIVEKDED